MDSATPTPAEAMMSGPCFVLCASHSTKNALFCNMVRIGGCASTFKRLPVRTALMSSSALAECLVSESAQAIHCNCRLGQASPLDQSLGMVRGQLRELTAVKKSYTKILHFLASQEVHHCMASERSFCFHSSLAWWTACS